MADTGNTNANTDGGARPAAWFSQIGKTLRRGEIMLAGGLVFILTVLILPMPAWLLDISLAFSITVSVLILMVVLFIQKPLDFSTFPTVLLIVTMTRLSLNLASTRLILTHGHEGTDAAGHVIEAFGGFIMGGNYVIGLIVFSILVLVNFVVITKGSGRIAEVSARFSLDAMPGKQMAIDADLSAGLIDEKEARARRKGLEDESNFFGSMDGAAKFVRGDAIAGLIITLINIVGGIIIGVAQQDLSMGDAAKSYTLLTVGDGLRSEEHTSELQSLRHLVCRLLLEKKKQHTKKPQEHHSTRPARKQKHAPNSARHHRSTIDTIDHPTTRAPNSATRAERHRLSCTRQ